MALTNYCREWACDHCGAQAATRNPHMSPGEPDGWVNLSVYSIDADSRSVPRLTAQLCGSCWGLTQKLLSKVTGPCTATE